MRPEDFIIDMKSAGFALALDGENLIVTPADRLTETHRQFIRAHKPALVRALAGDPPENRPAPSLAPDPLNPSGDPELSRLLSMPPGARLVALVQAGYRCEFEAGRLARVTRRATALPETSRTPRP